MQSYLRTVYVFERIGNWEKIWKEFKKNRMGGVAAASQLNRRIYKNSLNGNGGWNSP
jgi:hypothetical protein